MLLQIYYMVLIFQKVINTTSFKKFTCEEGKKFIGEDESETSKFFNQLNSIQNIMKEFLKKRTNPQLVDTGINEFNIHIRHHLQLSFIICFAFLNITENDCNDLYELYYYFLDNELNWLRIIHFTNTDRYYNRSCLKNERYKKEYENAKQNLIFKLKNSLNNNISFNVEERFAKIDVLKLKGIDRYYKESEISYYKIYLNLLANRNFFLLQMVDCYKKKK